MATEVSEEECVVRFPSTPLVKNSGNSSGGGSGSCVLELGRKLLAAAREGHTDVVRDLMSQGAPFTSDWLGTSPLHLAAMNGHAETCAVLLRAGISRDCRTKVDRTALHEAAAAGRARVTAVLLEAGASPHAQDLLRMTPLHWAVERGHADVAAELLRHGANPRAYSKFLLTPLQMAAGRGELQTLLEQADREPREEAEDNMDTEILEPEPELLLENAEVESDPLWTEEQAAAAEAQTAAEAQADSQQSVAAAAILRAHGITLLPADDGGTALSALRSGRTLVLSDAGRLLLKEHPPAAAAPVRLVANSVLPLQQNRVDNLQQMKFVQLPKEAKIVRPTPAPEPSPAAVGKRKHKTVKILVNKNHLGKLIAAANKSAAPTTPTLQAPPSPAAAPASPSHVVRVPEQFLRSTDPAYLRRQLLAAHASLASLRRRLGERTS